ncbi:zinc finger protein 660-like, partial [Teleopsis dalmanni]|uniref:zinc finger protein 660-like n=1 Tax=Teleopsis dalmanni TaxID=139649 RepID=UPI0018CDFD36
IRVGTTYSPVVGDFLKLIKSHSVLRSKRYVSPKAFDNAICDFKTKLNNRWNINTTSLGIRQSLNHLKKHNPNILNDLKHNQKLVKLLREKYKCENNDDMPKKEISKPKKRKMNNISKSMDSSTLKSLESSEENKVDKLDSEDVTIISDNNDNDSDSNNENENNDNDDDECSDIEDDDNDDDEDEDENDEEFNEYNNVSVSEDCENDTIITDHNYGQQNLSYTCDKCSASYKTEKKLKKHIFIEHNIGDNPYKCSGCNKLFRNAHNFRTHSILCLNRGQKYICHICGKYYSRFSIRHHMQLHQKPKFECKLCPKKYHKPYLFKEHMKTHKQARDNICEYCGKGYNTRKSLAVHRKVQHNLTFKCDICNLKLSSDAAVVRHKQYMHLALEGTNEELEERTKFNRYPKIIDPETKKKRYFCELCENTYANCSSLLSHRRNIHKIKPNKKNMYRKTVLRKWNKQKAASLQNSAKEETDEYIPHDEYQYIEMKEDDDIILEETEGDESFNLLDEYFELID